MPHHFTYTGWQCPLNEIPNQPNGPDDPQGPYTEGVYHRQEQSFPLQWKGVSGCAQEDKYRPKMRDAIEVWAKRRIHENRNHRWIPVMMGYSGGDALSDHEMDIGSSESVCKGWTQLKAFITFYEPGVPINFNVAYVATRDTEWISDPRIANPNTGPIPKGDFVFFANDPFNDVYVLARIGNNHQIRWVDVGHFRKVP